MPTHRSYFVMTPQLVWAICENAHQFVLWSAVKMVAGEEGVCVLGTRDLAALCMLGAGTVHQARQDLLRLGLLEGELRRDPGYPNEVWHLRVPDLWAANQAWREAHPSLRERIEHKRAQNKRAQNKRAQKERAQKEGAAPAWDLRQEKPEQARRWPNPKRSGPERPCSGPEPQGSEIECARSEPECRRSVPEPKKIPVLDLNEKQGRSLETAWENALVELALQLPRTTLDTWIRPLVPGGYLDGRDAVVLLCPNAYAQEWCRERLHPAIRRVLGGVLGRPGLEIEYRLAT